MGIEDGFARTCAAAQGRLQVLTSCPRPCGRRSSTASHTRNEASSCRSRP